MNYDSLSILKLSCGKNKLWVNKLTHWELVYKYIVLQAHALSC